MSLLHLESLKALATTTARAAKTSSLTSFRVFPNFLKINPATMEFQIKRNFSWSVILGHPTQLYKTGHKEISRRSRRQRINQKKWCMCRVDIFFIKRLLHMTFWTTWWNTSKVKISPGQPATSLLPAGEHSSTRGFCFSFFLKRLLTNPTVFVPSERGYDMKRFYLHLLETSQLVIKYTQLLGQQSFSSLCWEILTPQTRMLP